MERSQETDQICNECWDRALHAFGTAQIFLRRARWHEQALRYLSFVAVAVPVIVGVLVMTFGTGEYLPWVLGLAGALGAVQVVVSVWSVVATRSFGGIAVHRRPRSSHLYGVRLSEP